MPICSTNTLNKAHKWCSALATDRPMAPICQKCGDIGFSELLVYCRKCRTSAEHRYCLCKFPKKDEKVHWFCEECEPRPLEIASLENLAVDDSGKIEDDLQYNGQHPEILNHQKRFSQDNNVLSPKVLNGVACGSRHKMVDRESSPYISLEWGEKRKPKRRRRSNSADEDILDHNITNKVMELPTEPIGSQIVAPEYVAQKKLHVEQTNVVYNPASVNEHLPLLAQPIFDYVWRGYISFGNEEYGPLTAHISSLACQKVFDAAKLLPSVLCMEKLSRIDSMPNSFKKAPPTDDKIGLYFFPENTMVERVLELLDDVIKKDLMFKFMLDEVELLVFPSSILPKDHHRFQGNYHLWGAFRRKQVPIAAPSPDCLSKPSELKEENKKTEVSDKTARGNAEAELSDVTISTCIDKQKSLESDCSGDLEEGEICDLYIERKDREMFEEGQCLNLFPLQVEDMGIASKIGSSDELSLELGLSRNSAGIRGEKF